MFTYIHSFGCIIFIFYTFFLNNQNNLLFAKNSSSEELPDTYVDMVTYNCEYFVNQTKNTPHGVILANQFRNWDKNNDSYLTTEEYLNWEEDHDHPLGKQMALALMEQYGIDTDGRTSLEEYLYFVYQSDANNDDVITLEECIEYHLGKYRAAWKTLNNSTGA